MSNVVLARRGVLLPRWTTLLLVTFSVLATASLAQGFFDIVLPALVGGEPFGFLFRLTDAFGTVVFAGYVFVHNLGLACLVPGFGFFAAYFEKRGANRTLIGTLLAGSVVLALRVAQQYIVMSGRFDLWFALPLFALEAAGVLVLALPAARELRGFVPTPAYEWSLVAPFHRLVVPFYASIVLLAVASAAETWFVFA